MTSRRSFLLAGGAGGCAAAQVRSKAGGGAVPVTRAAIESETVRRAEEALKAATLDVDYYRIRRKLAYPLPVTSLSIPSMRVPSIPDYPWSIWMLWALEDRIHSLAWAAEWRDDARFAKAASRDLAGLAEFPKYCQLTKPDLAAGHAGRILWTASRQWKFPDSGLRRAVADACERHVREVLPMARTYYGAVRSKADLEPVSPSYMKVHNIALIGTIGAALAAEVCGDASLAELNTIIGAVFEKILDLRSGGYTEAVAYDGYVLDFIADWMRILTPAARDRFFSHPNFDGALEQSYRLAAPGAMMRVAEIGDVEPREMTFHFSAQAKLARWKPGGARGWYLREPDLGWVRPDALGPLHAAAGSPTGSEPPAGALDAHYARALRTGWKADDLAVVASCSTSPAGHLQLDSGTVVIGTRGEWLISDPGYQQYMKGEERDFTIGPTAHNCPLIEGAAQDRKQARVLASGAGPDGTPSLKLDLAACYPARLKLGRVVRTIWLPGRASVVIADEIETAAPVEVKYHWHGHPDAAWWGRDGRLRIHLGGTDLWLGSPQVPLDLSAVARLPGSRGQLTAAASLGPAPRVIWWVFTLGGPVQAELSEGDRVLRLNGRSFAV